MSTITQEGRCCGRCKARTRTLFDYPVGAKRVRVCPACWEGITGRAHRPSPMAAPRREADVPEMFR